MLAKLMWGTRARLVAETLAGCVDGPIAVLDAAPLAQLLGETVRRVLLVTTQTRRGFDGPTLRAAGQALPFSAAGLAALVAPMASEEQLAAWIASVRTGGKLVLVDREDAEEASRRLLCIGMVDPEQRRAARTVVTSGTVWRTE